MQLFMTPSIKQQFKFVEKSRILLETKHQHTKVLMIVKLEHLRQIEDLKYSNNRILRFLSSAFLQNQKLPYG